MGLAAVGLDLQSLGVDRVVLEVDPSAVGVHWHRPGVDLSVHWHRCALGMNSYRLTVDSDAVGVDLCALGMNWYRR